MKLKFPEEIEIAYSICKKCNHSEFIVDGQTQICNYCNKLMFREISKKYSLIKHEKNVNLENIIDKKKDIFPEKLNIAYAHCNKKNCNYGEYVVLKDKVICQYCLKQMELKNNKYYSLNN